MITALSIILQCICAPIGLYYLIIGFIGFLPFSKNRRTLSQKTNRFAVTVAAHNEEAVIANLIHSLRALDYPKDAYDIFVIADNCTDNTAAVARAEGAIVYERCDTLHRGKGYALEWFFDKLFNMQYDYIAVFDADNLAAPNFLTEMNKSVNRGYEVVQSFLDSKNPYDTWISASYSYCFWCINRIFQLPRHKLGMCCELSGTGFVIETDFLKKIGWCADCLTEDMEFTMRTALAGEKIGFCSTTRVFDEKPLTLAQSWRQRVRWMRGHCDVASRYFFKLVKAGIKNKSLSAIDCAVYLVQPIRIIAMGIILFFAYAQSFYPSGDLGFIQLSYLFKNPVVWNLITIFQCLYTPFVVLFERREFKLKMLPYFMLYPLYNLTWIPIAIQGLLQRKNKDWVHTQHVKNISIDEFK